MNTDFTQQQGFLLGAGFLLLLAGFWLFHSGRTKPAVLLLLSAAACMFSFAAVLDPFLNLWDERFHALVAKNLLKHPLRPAIYADPVVAMAYDRWDRAVIWLHKQPLFLWQSMLSFKLFGVNEFAFRLPNIFLGIAFTYSVFRIGKLLVSEKTGFYAAALALSTPYILELIAGRKELDQNDFSFMCYVSLSIWTFVEYSFSGKKRWLVLTGLFSGCAVLCKWLVGLLVYFGGITYRLVQKKWRVSQNKDLLLSLIVTLAVVLPWQLLILSWYPVEAKAEYTYSSLHFTEAIEGHRGDFLYYFQHFGEMYGTLIPFIVLPGCVVMYRVSADRKLTAALFAMTAFLYLFFSLAVTKMPSFTIVGIPVVMLACGAFFSHCTELINRKMNARKAGQLVGAGLVFAFVLLRTDAAGLSSIHSLASPENEYGRMLVHNQKIFTRLKLAPETVLFNVKGRHYVEAMFYTGLPAYNFYPSREMVADLRKKGRKIAVFSSAENLPPELRGEELLLLPDTLKGYE